MAASTSPACTDVYILGARGTDQPYNDKGIGGWYADVIGRTVDQFKAQVLARDPSMKDHFHDVALPNGEYPADGGWYFSGAILHVPSWYYKSVTSGKDNGRRHVNDVINNPGACVLFTGYSQGAQVTADLLEEFTQSHPTKVLGGIFYGDPYFRGDSRYGSSGRWPTPYNATQHGGLGQRPEFPSALQSRVISTCHGKDPVCQGVSWSKWPPKPDIDLDAHSAYTRDASNPANHGNDMTEEAADSARRIVSRMGFPRPPAPKYTGPVDVVFAVDTTGSMGGIIEDAKSYVRAFPADNDANLPDVRYGLVDYRDVGDDYVTRVDVQPTTDRAAFTSAVDGLYASGGGDWEEAVFAAASTAMDTDLRPKARKIVIFVGDAPGHDPDMYTGETLSQITSKAVNKKVILSAVDYGYGITTFADMAAATGGAVINPYATTTATSRLADSLASSAAAGNEEPKPAQLDDQMVVDAPAAETTDTATTAAENPLLDAVLKSVSQPEARLAVVAPAYVGIPTTLNASGSSDPIGYLTQYEWDYDNDGTYDQVTDYPAVQHSFTSTGDHTIGLRVTNDVGDTGVTNATTTVEDLPADYPLAVPNTPPAPGVAAGDESITLTIKPPTQGTRVYSYTVRDAETGQVTAIVPANPDGTPTDPVTVTGLVNGKQYTFTVMASNAAGDGPASDPSAPVTPAPAVTPAPQQQTALVKVPKKIKYKGKTVLLKKSVKTNAGQKAKIKVIVKPKGKRYSKVKITSKGKVTIRTLGKKRLKVTLKLTAPATSQYTSYSYTKKWKVKKKKHS